MPTDLCGGHVSTAASTSTIDYLSSSAACLDICRICHCEADVDNPLLSPCFCAGSLKYVHQACLQQWLSASDTKSCELCKFNFILQTKFKPITKWRRLEMSNGERRRLLCAILFHFVAAACVVWSLFVLIERATEEVQKGIIGWPFWTKLVVVAVGFTGGIVFMYIQCKQYMSLFTRWKSHNRIILVQNAPEKTPAILHSPTTFRSTSSSTATNSTVSTLNATNQQAQQQHVVDDPPRNNLFIFNSKSSKNVVVTSSKNDVNRNVEDDFIRNHCNNSDKDACRQLQPCTTINVWLEPPCIIENSNSGGAAAAAAGYVQLSPSYSHRSATATGSTHALDRDALLAKTEHTLLEASSPTTTLTNNTAISSSTTHHRSSLHKSLPNLCGGEQQQQQPPQQNTLRME